MRKIAYERTATLADEHAQDIQAQVREVFAEVDSMNENTSETPPSPEESQVVVIGEDWKDKLFLVGLLALVASFFLGIFFRSYPYAIVLLIILPMFSIFACFIYIKRCIQLQADFSNGRIQLKSCLTTSSGRQFFFMFILVIVAIIGLVASTIYVNGMR